MTNKVNLNEYKGISLFNDIEDQQLKTRNRAVVLTNILEDSFHKGKVSMKGGALILGYFNEVPETERIDLRNEFVKQAKERGFINV